MFQVVLLYFAYGALPVVVTAISTHLLYLLHSQTRKASIIVKVFARIVQFGFSLTVLTGFAFFIAAVLREQGLNPGPFHADPWKFVPFAVGGLLTFYLGMKKGWFKKAPPP